MILMSCFVMSATCTTSLVLNLVLDHHYCIACFSSLYMSGAANTDADSIYISVETGSLLLTRMTH